MLRKILIISTIAILFADTPDWEDDPGAYEFVATLSGGIILADCLNMNMAEEDDMFAAFDEDGNVRGVAVQLTPSFGPYVGQIVYEMTLRSNAVGDILSFKYYDASEDVVLNIVETYEFVINDIIGSLVNPKLYTTDIIICLAFANATSSSVNITYDSDIAVAGVEFNVAGVTVTGASGGAAETAGFTIASSATTVLAFSLSGATIPAGSGTLLSLEFANASENQTLTVSNVIISDDGGSAMASSGPGSIAIEPEPFTYRQSTLQAFYFFNLVLINDIEVASNDWVGAFNGDVCVGARKWDTSQCGSGICDVPVMGNEGSEYTAGYCNPGDIPTFKIYDASENLYYTAESSENLEWISQGLLVAEVLLANVTLYGCTDSDYCNYDPSATVDDGSCNYLCTGCTNIDACNYSANATIDDGSCYDAEDNYDCGGNCVAEVDCQGICGGTSVDDECGVCGGNNSTCLDCAGISNGNSLADMCGTCDSDSSNNCVQDCAGTWGGNLVDDECGICGGPGPTLGCGCDDILDGYCDCDGSTLDQCGVCGGNNSTCLDCADVPNGSAILDNCGTCNADSSNECVQDCAGTWGGELVDDECGICGGDNSTCLDCAEVPNGSAILDNCGTCNADSSNECVQDCAGTWGGDLVDDECGICGGDCFGESGVECDDGLTDCAGNCVAELDCQGICGGNKVPTFQCQNTCVVCNPADCNNLDSDCNSMAISPYLLPDKFGISKIFPNPFNPVTHIQYELTQFGLISIKIYDIQGRIVAQLINEYQSPGHYSLNWNAINHASGMYIVEMLMQLENAEVSRDLQKILYLK